MYIGVNTDGADYVFFINGYKHVQFIKIYIIFNISAVIFDSGIMIECRFI